MPPQKHLDLTTTNFRRTKAELRDTSTNTVSYNLDFSFALRDFGSQPNQHAVTLKAPSTNPETTIILGTCDFSFTSMSLPIHLCFGDPNSPNPVWEDVKVNGKWMQNGFELTLNIGEGQRKSYAWKRTHNVKAVSGLARKIDMFHLKMVDAETGEVKARFVHNIMMGKKRGSFEIEEGGRRWEEFVVLSGVAVLEYCRKAQGWSW